MEIKPIAYYHGLFGSKFGVPRQSGVVPDLPGRIVFEPEFRNPLALKGLDGFDYVWLIWEFSENRASQKDWSPTVRPPRLGGNEHIGVFASRSPYRPNPLGLSSVKVGRIADDGSWIEVLGADLVDGTPIYDIKPYVTYADSHPSARSGFVDERGWSGLKVVFLREAEEVVKESGCDREILSGVLSQDPRPKYHNDPERVYGMPFAGLDIHFKVNDSTVTVISATPLPSL